MAAESKTKMVDINRLSELQSPSFSPPKLRGKTLLFFYAWEKMLFDGKVRLSYYLFKYLQLKNEFQ